MSMNTYTGIRVSVSFFLILIYSSVVSEEYDMVAEDTTQDIIIFYSDYSELLAFRIYTITKWNTLDIIN